MKQTIKSLPDLKGPKILLSNTYWYRTCCYSFINDIEAYIIINNQPINTKKTL